MNTQKQKPRIGVYLLVMSGTLLIPFAFNNCGQPGAINLKNTDALSQDLQSIPDDPDPGPNPNPTFKAKESSVFVNANPTDKVDVLVVIDNSGSMKTEQQNMKDRFSNFIDKLSGLNWQLGIITTDVSRDSELRDGRLIEMSGLNTRVLNSSMNINTVKTAFGNTIQRSESGSGSEQGIRASYRAVERSQENGSDNQGNRELFRDDAALSVIVVTDADETPSGSYGLRNSGPNFISYVKSIWPQKAISFHSIIVQSGDSECKKKDGNESYGVRYEELSTLTNGVIGTVCAQDYGSQLSLIGQKTVDLIKSMTLSCTPVDTNGDGTVDIEIRDANNTLITGFTRTGVEIKFNSNLPPGKTTAKYYCLQ